MERVWLSEMRNKLNMTHDVVAIKANISRQYYGMIESGLRNPSVDLAKRIAAILHFNWTLFFEDEGNKMFPSVVSSKEVI